MLKRLYLFAIVAVLSSCSIFAPQDKHLLWEVKSENASVHLLGSVHIAKPDIYPLDPVIENAFDSSRYLAVELDISEVDPMEMIKYATYPTGETLKENISEESYTKLKSLFREHGISESVYNSYKPWMASMILMQLELSQSGYEQNSGIDMHFIQKAKEQDKEILELETLEQQMQLFDKLEGKSDEYLAYSIKDMKNTVKKMDEIFQRWQEGDADGLDDIMNEEFDIEGGDVIEDELLIKRNKRMTTKIKSYLNKGGTYFVVVGAAHLVGDNGIIRALNSTNEYEIKQK